MARVRLRGRVGPLEVREVVVEVEGPRELLRRDVHERGELLRPSRPAGACAIGGEPALELGRRDLPAPPAPAAAVLHQEVVGEVVRDDRRRGRSPPARSPTSRRRRRSARLSDRMFQRALTWRIRLVTGSCSPARVDGDEVADAVAVGRLSGRDRRPDDGGEERLLRQRAARRRPRAAASRSSGAFPRTSGGRSSRDPRRRGRARTRGRACRRGTRRRRRARRRRRGRAPGARRAGAGTRRDSTSPVRAG